MAEETPLSEAIEQSAAGDKSVTVDGTTVNAHSLREQIEADKYLRAIQAGQHRRRLPIRFFRITPGGAA